MKYDFRKFRHPDLGLLLIRCMVGIVGVYHGGQKLFGLFGGGGVRGTAAYFEQELQFPLPMLSVITIGTIEFLCGILIAVGFLMRIAVIPFAAGMLVAALYVHGHAFGIQFEGMEYPLTLAVILIALFLTGPGRYTINSAEKGLS